MDPTAPADEEGQQRSIRRRLLEAAYVVFGSHGIAGSTPVDVADQAGVSPSELHAHFTEKDDLVLALLEEHVLHRLAAAADQFVSAGSQREALAEVGQLLVQAMRIDATAHRLLAEQYALASHDPHRHAALASRRREAHEAVTRVLMRLTQITGMRLVLSHEQTAVVLLALSNGLGIEAGLNPDAVSEDLLGTLLTLMVSNA